MFRAVIPALLPQAWRMSSVPSRTNLVWNSQPGLGIPVREDPKQSLLNLQVQALWV
jgi:hypothetical protein